MTSRPFTSGELSQLDQGMAHLNAALDAGLRVIRQQIAEDGEAQALANTALLVTRLQTPAENTNLLLPALMRLARQPEQEKES